MAEFFRRIYRSVVDFSWYGTIVSEGVASAFRYFFLFIFFISVLFALSFVYPLARRAPEVARTLEEQVPEFTATIKDHVLLVGGIPQPYTYEIENFGPLVVDTTGSTQDISEDANGILIRPDEAIIRFRDGETREMQAVSFTELPDLTFTKKEVIDTIRSRGPLLVLLAGLVILLIKFVGSSVAVLISCLVVSWVGLLFARRRYSALRFPHVLSIALYAVTGPSILSSAIQSFSRPIPFLFSALLVVYFVHAIRKGALETLVQEKK